MIKTKRMMLLSDSQRITVNNLLTSNQSDGGDTLNPELLTLNQRTGTDTLGNTTGFTGIGTTPGTISSSTEQAHTGTKSLKCVTSGGDVGEGVKVNATTVSNTTVYIAGAWIYAPNGATLEISQYSNDESTPVAVTGTGAWQWVECSDTTGTTTNEIWVKTKTSAQAITFFVDDLRLAKTDTTGFGKNAGDETFTITGETSYQGYRSLKIDGTGTNRGMAITQSGLTVGQSYTVQAKIKSEAGKTVRIIFGTSTDFVADGRWQSKTITFTATGTSHTLLILSREAGALTIYIDQLMLETGDKAHDWIIGQGSYSFFRSRE